MSEYAYGESSPAGLVSDTNLQTSLDDSANNSIIGKVKSRVSSIIPSRLSKWFSPSAKLQNDSLNGSMCNANITLPSRRRRRIEVEEENYGDDDVHRCRDYEEGSNYMSHRRGQNRDRNIDVNDNNEDDDSQNSEDEYACSSDLNVERQPPSKKSRLNIEFRDSPNITRHQPLLSSTPAAGNAYFRNSGTVTTSRSSYPRLTHLNLYGKQSKKDPPFNFGQQKESKVVTKGNTDIIDLITNSNYEREENLTEPSNVYDSSRTRVSSRKSLNIPSTSALTLADERAHASISHLKRQPLSSARPDLTSANAVEVPLTRTSMNLQGVEYQFVEDHDQNHYDGIENRDELLSDANTNTYNGSIDSPNNFRTNKSQNLINGKGLNVTNKTECNEGIILDSASESGESAIDVIKTTTSNTQQSATGLFNMKARGIANTRNSSRTSSFGNGLNFYSHLEGRKSLFSAAHHGNSNPLNNSTLSLTSLNRRQFNASIYGSTSALSDSRLLNTFSPFYKGKTTYGGAAAYNKYSVSAGASAVRITPTLIRPTSSLSTLSSSNNSLVNTINSQVGESSAISSTAKRILDLINDFATPLSEAKKMASNLKTNPNLAIPPQAKGRLNESDLNASRAARLLQVRTPYSRPAIILQPSGNASGRSMVGGILPPVKELQVPTISQLLQMKKMQNTTEKARKIANNSVAKTVISEYTLPDVASSKNNTQNIFEQAPQKHTNKIKNKAINSFRSSAASKDLHGEEPPPSVHLPNIAFPLMQSVPKIDIKINKTSTPDQTNPGCKTLKLSPVTEASNFAQKDSSSKSNSSAYNIAPINTETQTSVSTGDNKKVQLSTTQQNISTLKFLNTFTFAEPLQVEAVLPPTQSISKKEIEKYKFSPPLDVLVSPLSECFKEHNTPTKKPHLKEGSCLDALSKPFVLPPTTSANTFSINALSGFDNKFKKSSNEWECETCMIRNKTDINKCEACETPRKQKSSTLDSAGLTSAASSFGQQFYKQSNEWECNACMLRNKEGTTKCIACETQRTESKTTAALSPFKNLFGNSLKAQSDSWECEKCMIFNRNEINECVACQAKKPGCTNTLSAASSQSAVTGVKLNFGNTNCDADAGFKTLAAQQKISKWECDACMTRNDANRNKCACCEQPKPGIGNAESTNAVSSKFQFGATAASRFSFGFGTGANALKEEELRQLSSKTEESAKQSSSTLSVGTTQSAPAQCYQFGINPAVSSTSELKKDETDGNKQLTGFKFSNPASTSDAVLPHTSFVFGSRPFTATTTSSTSTPTSSAAAPNNPSVNFSLPRNTTSPNINNNDKNKVVPLPAFGSITECSTPAGFSFANKIVNTKATAAAIEENKTSNNIGFKPPATISNISSVAPTSVTTSTATEAVKPIFSFGTNTLATPAVSSQGASTFNSFNFGSNSTNNLSTTTANKFFVAATSTSSVTTIASATTKTSSSTSTITTPASTNIFGSFGGGAGLANASGSSIFGASVNLPANNNLSTVSSSTNNPTPLNTPQFGALGSKTTSKVFGSFGGVDAINSALENPNGTKPTLPLFGNVAQSSTSQSSHSNSSGFGFGCNATNDTTIVTTATTGSVTSTNTIWAKNSFVFGSPASATSLTNSVEPVNANENKEVANPIFGSFISCSTNSNNQLQSSSIFGVPASNSITPLSGLGTTASGTTNSSTNVFGTSSVPAATSIFGANSSGNAVTPAPAFGSSPFGGTASSTSATPTFGSTAASGTTFGSFGSTSINTTTNITGVKKPETAFNFGAASTTQSTSGGFNFGSSASTTKPAFNFGGTSTTLQPTFNFTGTSESQSSTKPFQFGATPSAPVFNFNRGVLEGTPNAPFQFNAGAAPVSSNIFAPAPTQGVQTAQQAKRKIRAPIKRVTQR